jgi:Ricin-type beta-trefoil lectin domain/Lysozyme like domain
MRPIRLVASAGVAALALVAAVLPGSPAQAGTRPVAPQGAGPRASCTQQSFLEGDHYSAVQVAQLARNAGFGGNDWVVSVAVAEAESAGWTRARLINTDCSVDRGLWQINSYWHGEVSDACAFDPACNAGATHTIWSNGGWTQWTTYNNGAYLSHMAEAQDAVNQVNGGGGGRHISGYGGRCVDVDGPSSANGTAIQLWDCNTSPGQQWTLNGDGSLTSLGKCMDVAGNVTNNGALVQLWDCWGGPNQKWVLTAAGDIVNPQANRCLDAKDWGSSNGTRLQIWDCSGGANQKWTVS